MAIVGPVMDALHRILTGQALTPRQLAIGGGFIMLWFAMDVIQFADMVTGWMK